MTKGWLGDKRGHSIAAKRGHMTRKKNDQKVLKKKINTSNFIIREAKNFNDLRKGYTVFYVGSVQPIYVDFGQPNWFRTRSLAQRFINTLEKKSGLRSVGNMSVRETRIKGRTYLLGQIRLNDREILKELKKKHSNFTYMAELRARNKYFRNELRRLR